MVLFWRTCSCLLYLYAFSIPGQHQENVMMQGCYREESYAGSSGNSSGKSDAGCCAWIELCKAATEDG